MDKNRIEGIARQAKGTIKEATGKITGNGRLEAEGKAEKVAGHAQEKFGRAKDAITKALK
ncbi:MULTISPECIES: CsbD family protein [Agrobacterium tumefaciens complex]|uniref:CsbD-like protein n=1 Tax=Agrobacterium tomkonis CFBP 6623 TaxID=1183432 RepID=A0A1S7S0W7_9HYPH|nr:MULTISPECIES: CsbD family protein [Agrobacterium tumefaciens complex]QCL92219.1 CsbD family protein [Agrobacterium tumefaciens]CUX60930.1 CsbD-like protein [Agrobacterium tomkonis CFBP 6623]